MPRRLAPLLVALSALAPLGAAAQPGNRAPDAVIMIRVTGGFHGLIHDGDESFTWASSLLLERLKAAGGEAIEAPVTSPSASTEGVTRRRLEAFEEVEALLVEARSRAGHLDEAGALASLMQALRVVESHADVAGSSRWVAEVRVALGVVAAQAGLEGLMEASLASAALLDPSRGLGAAEARPSVTARAAEIAREVATRPRGRFIVHSDAPGAVVFLDDRPFGPSPAAVEAPIGRHLLRVEAPDHLPYGAMIDLFEGERAEMPVALARTPRASLEADLFDRGARYDVEALVEALARARREGRPLRAWLIDAGPGARERALLTRCDDRGCSAPLRLERALSAPEAPTAPLAARSLYAGRALDLDWLSADVAGARPPPRWYQRWYVWVPVGVILLGAAAASTAAVRRRPDDDLEIIIDFSNLAP